MSAFVGPLYGEGFAAGLKSAADEIRRLEWWIYAFWSVKNRLPRGVEWVPGSVGRKP
jgi:hypothetical protein